MLCHPWIPKFLHWGRAKKTTWKKFRFAWTRFVLMTSVILLLLLISITAMVIVISFFFRSSQYENFIFSFLFVIVVVIRCKSGILEQSFLLSALHSEKDSFGLQQVILVDSAFFCFQNIIHVLCLLEKGQQSLIKHPLTFTVLLDWSMENAFCHCACRTLQFFKSLLWLHYKSVLTKGVPNPEKISPWASSKNLQPRSGMSLRILKALSSK